MNDTSLSAGANVGYFFLGFVLGLIGILIAWLINRDKPIMKEAIKFSVIGCVVVVVFYCVLTIGLGGLATCAALNY